MTDYPNAPVAPMGQVTTTTDLYRVAHGFDLVTRIRSVDPALHDRWYLDCAPYALNGLVELVARDAALSREDALDAILATYHSLHP